MNLEILYQDNHIVAVNKESGQLVQPDPSGEPALEQAIGEYLRVAGGKPGQAFVGVVHRLDRPVSGVVIFAKTSKALVRLNEQIRDRQIRKIYWAIVENAPQQSEGELRHYIVRNPKNNKSAAFSASTKGGQEAILRYRHMVTGDRYHLLEVELVTGRHHQIRAQLAAIGCIIKGDLKYGAKRSNLDGSISLHAREVSFQHPVRKEERVCVVAPPPQDNLWRALANLAMQVPIAKE